MNNQQQRNSASESSGQVDTNTSVIVDRVGASLRLICFLRRMSVLYHVNVYELVLTLPSHVLRDDESRIGERILRA